MKKLICKFSFLDGFKIINVEHNFDINIRGRFLKRTSEYGYLCLKIPYEFKCTFDGDYWRIQVSKKFYKRNKQFLEQYLEK